MVVDAFAGTFFAANVFLLLPKHKRFIGFEDDPSHMAALILKLILIYSRRDLSKKQHLDGNENVCSSVKVYARVVETINV